MNYKIVIDAGHGGTDSGAVGNGIIEKELTLKISKYIYDRLKELGIDVKMTRYDDETVNPSERINRIINSYGDGSDVIVISNHINAGGGDGAEVIYALRNNDTLPNKILTELKNAGQNVRKSYQRTLPTDPTKDYYFIQRETGNTESLIIEYGFLDSKGDDINGLKNNWKEYAEAVVKALIEYMNLTYIPINQNYYKVEKGDTLWSIAKRFNTTVNEIKEENGLTGSLLSIDQVLKIPSSIEKELNNIYIVKKGDTLWNIARNYDTTVNELIKINNLINTNLSIGQRLNIPISTYKVQSGDTLYSIAKRFDTTVSELKKLNNLISDILSIGQILKFK